MERSEKRAEAEREYASVVVKVVDRDALPVRAIPYVTGWTISPDELAKSFAKSQAAPFEKLCNTDTYHLLDGKPAKLLPKEWDRYVAALEGLEAGLREQFPNNDRGYAAWVAQSVEKLPAGVFVWLDAFEADFSHDHGPDRLSIMEEREGDRDLNLSPFLESETLDMVLEGFATKAPLLNYKTSDIVASFAEQVLNGRLIDWRYWVHNMPSLSAAEAARLMAGLDPDLFEDLTARPAPKNDPSRACAEARRMERLAMAEGHARLAPENWYRWALEHDFSVHRGFFLAAYGRQLLENEAEVLASMPRAEAARWERAHVIGDGERQVSMEYSGHISTVTMTFPDFAAEVEERLAAWRRGRYVLIEAAHVLADSASMDAKQLAEQMEAAIHAGKLTYRINNIRVDPQHIPKARLLHREVFEADVNAWLSAEAIGGSLRLEYPYQNEVPTAESECGVENSLPPSGDHAGNRAAQSISETSNSHTLSTDEVSEAFDAIGMTSAEWRRLLTKDRPDWLKACMATKGKPGATPVQGRWFPLKIAEALVTGKSRKTGCVPASALDRAFRRPLLRPGLEAWNDMRADNPVWGD